MVTSPSVAVTLALLCVVLVIWLRAGDGPCEPDWARVAMRGKALGGTLLYARSVAVGSVIAAAPILVDAYVGARSAQRGWEGFVQRTGATYALLPDDSPLGDALARESGWVRVGTDAEYTLLRAPS